MAPGLLERAAITRCAGCAANDRPIVVSAEMHAINQRASKAATRALDVSLDLAAPTLPAPTTVLRGGGGASSFRTRSARRGRGKFLTGSGSFRVTLASVQFNPTRPNPGQPHTQTCLRVWLARVWSGRVELYGSKRNPKAA